MSEHPTPQLTSAALFESALDAIVVIDEDGTVVDWNPSAVELFGYSRDRAVGASLAELIIPEDLREQHRQGLQRYLSTGRSVVLETRLELDALHEAGHRLRIELTIVDSSEDGRAQFTGWMRDVSALGQTTSHLQALVSSLADGVLFVDPDLRVTSVNQAFCDLFGFVGPPSTLVGQTIETIRAETLATVADPEAFLSRVKEVYAATLPEMAEEILLRSGSLLERDYIPVRRDDQLVGHLWLYRDVSDRKRMEQAREQAMVAEKAARERAEEQNEGLRELADLKSELVAMVSHELRTPLTSILSFSELLRTEIGPDGAEDLVEFVDIVDRNAKRLLRLVEDLLLLGELESGLARMDPTRFSARRLVENAVEDMGPQAAAKAVTLTAEPATGPAAFGDQDRLLQVLQNLISNGIKFTPEGGRVAVTARHRAAGWTFGVADNGPGVPDAAKDQLFERFFRLPATAKHTSGSGLGLAICRSIVDLHGGSIAVGDSAEGGTVVEFTIPDEPAP